MAEIKPHFLKSIREIDGDIVELQNSITPIQNDIGRLLATRATIVELYGADTEISPAPGTPIPVEEKKALRQQRPTGDKPKRTYTRRQPRAASAAGGVSRGRRQRCNWRCRRFGIRNTFTWPGAGRNQADRGSAEYSAAVYRTGVGRCRRRGQEVRREQNQQVEKRGLDRIHGRGIPAHQ